MSEVIFSTRNISLSPAQQKHITKKIGKHKKLLDKATSISVVVEHHSSHSNADSRIKIELLVKMPHAYIKASSKGSDIESITDNIDYILKRKLKRYNDQFKRWSKETPWKATEIQETLDEHSAPLEPDTYLDYVPQIKRKQYEDESPIYPAEAIERMELLGYNSFLFKNIESGKYSMLYKRENGGYGLVEPKNG